MHLEFESSGESLRDEMIIGSKSERLAMDENKGKSEIILYQTEDGQTKLQVKMEDETVWLTHDQMAELFEKSKSTINEHIKNIYEEKELD